MNEKPFDIVIPGAVGANPGLARELRNGKILTVLSATGAFFVSRDNTPRVDLNAGRIIGNDNSPEFSVLMFYNTGVAPVTARILVSFHPYSGELPVSATINTTVTVSGKNAPTYPKGTTGVIAAGGTAVFNGVDVGAQVRKSFSVFNNHAVDDLHVRGANGVLMHIVPARTGYPVECGGSITLYNPGANPITYAASEVFYV